MPFDGKTPPPLPQGRSHAWRGFLVGLFGVLGFALGMAVLTQELAW